MTKVIEIKNLTKKYQDLIAVNDISFYIEKGQVFGILGENGAGKTTTMEMIEGLRKPTAGQIKVLGKDVRTQLDSIKERVGVQLQATAYYNFLTLKEILVLLGGFYQKRTGPQKLLGLVGLESKADVLINQLSGGQKQRFSIVASLVNDPEIVFLDEPTTGLDPLARRNLWKLITQINNQGKTIILTTHYLEEAEMLCDRIAIMDRGSIIAMGETKKLIEKAQNPFKIIFTVSKIQKRLFSQIFKLGELKNLVSKQNEFELKLKTQAALNQALELIQKMAPLQITVGRATLEDLFIELTGRTISENNNHQS